MRPPADSAVGVDEPRRKGTAPRFFEAAWAEPLPVQLGRWGRRRWFRIEALDLSDSRRCEWAELELPDAYPSGRDPDRAELQRARTVLRSLAFSVARPALQQMLDEAWQAAGAPAATLSLYLAESGQWCLEGRTSDGLEGRFVADLDVVSRPDARLSWQVSAVHCFSARGPSLDAVTDALAAATEQALRRVALPRASAIAAAGALPVAELFLWSFLPRFGFRLPAVCDAPLRAVTWGRDRVHFRFGDGPPVASAEPEWRPPTGDVRPPCGEDEAAVLRAFEAWAQEDEGAPPPLATDESVLGVLSRALSNRAAAPGGEARAAELAAALVRRGLPAPELWSLHARWGAPEDRATAWATAARAWAPSRPDLAGLAWCASAVAHGASPSARTAWAAAHRCRPDDAGVSYALARAHLNASAAAAALDALRVGLDASPSRDMRAQMLALSAEATEALGDSSGAKRLYLDALSIQPERIDAGLGLVRAMGRLGEVSAAEKRANALSVAWAASGEKEALATLHCLLGDIFAFEDADAALMQYRQALTADAEHLGAIARLAELAWRRGDIPAAARHVGLGIAAVRGQTETTMAAAAPSTRAALASIHAIGAEVALRRGDRAGRLRHLEARLVHQPDDLEALARLAAEYEAAENFDGLKSCQLRQAMVLGARGARSAAWAAWQAFAHGPGATEAIFERALRALDDGGAPEDLALRVRALLLECRGRWDEAAMALAKWFQCSERDEGWTAAVAADAAVCRAHAGADPMPMVAYAIGAAGAEASSLPVSRLAEALAIGTTDGAAEALLSSIESSPLPARQWTPLVHAVATAQRATDPEGAHRLCQWLADQDPSDGAALVAAVAGLQAPPSFEALAEWTERLSALPLDTGGLPEALLRMAHWAEASSHPALQERLLRRALRLSGSAAANAQRRWHDLLMVQGRDQERAALLRARGHDAHLGAEARIEAWRSAAEIMLRLGQNAAAEADAQAARLLLKETTDAALCDAVEKLWDRVLLASGRVAQAAARLEAQLKATEDPSEALRLHLRLSDLAWHRGAPNLAVAQLPESVAPEVSPEVVLVWAERMLGFHRWASAFGGIDAALRRAMEGTAAVSSVRGAYDAVARFGPDIVPDSLRSALPSWGAHLDAIFSNPGDAASLEAWRSRLDGAWRRLPWHGDVVAAAVASLVAGKRWSIAVQWLSAFAADLASEESIGLWQACLAAGAPLAPDSADRYHRVLVDAGRSSLALAFAEKMQAAAFADQLRAAEWSVRRAQDLDALGQREAAVSVLVEQSRMGPGLMALARRTGSVLLIASAYVEDARRRDDLSAADALARAAALFAEHPGEAESARRWATVASMLAPGRESVERSYERVMAMTSISAVPVAAVDDALGGDAHAAVAVSVGDAEADELTRWSREVRAGPLGPWRAVSEAAAHPDVLWRAVEPAIKAMRRVPYAVRRAFARAACADQDWPRVVEWLLAADAPSPMEQLEAAVVLAGPAEAWAPAQAVLLRLAERHAAQVVAQAGTALCAADAVWRLALHLNDADAARLVQPWYGVLSAASEFVDDRRLGRLAAWTRPQAFDETQSAAFRLGMAESFWHTHRRPAALQVLGAMDFEGLQALAPVELARAWAMLAQAGGRVSAEASSAPVAASPGRFEAHPALPALESAYAAVPPERDAEALPLALRLDHAYAQAGRHEARISLWVAHSAGASAERRGRTLYWVGTIRDERLNDPRGALGAYGRAHRLWPEALWIHRAWARQSGRLGTSAAASAMESLYLRISAGAGTPREALGWALRAASQRAIERDDAGVRQNLRRVLRLPPDEDAVALLVHRGFESLGVAATADLMDEAPPAWQACGVWQAAHRAIRMAGLPGAPAPANVDVAAHGIDLPDSLLAWARCEQILRPFLPAGGGHADGRFTQTMLARLESLIAQGDPIVAADALSDRADALLRGMKLPAAGQEGSRQALELAEAASTLNPFDARSAQLRLLASLQLQDFQRAERASTDLVQLGGGEWSHDQAYGFWRALPEDEGEGGLRHQWASHLAPILAVDLSKHGPPEAVASAGPTTPAGGVDASPATVVRVSSRDLPPPDEAPSELGASSPGHPQGEVVRQRLLASAPASVQPVILAADREAMRTALDTVSPGAFADWLWDAPLGWVAADHAVFWEKLRVAWLRSPDARIPPAILSAIDARRSRPPPPHWTVWRTDGGTLDAARWLRLDVLRRTTAVPEWLRTQGAMSDWAPGAQIIGEVLSGEDGAGAHWTSRPPPARLRAVLGLQPFGDLGDLLRELAPVVIELLLPVDDPVVAVAVDDPLWSPVDALRPLFPFPWNLFVGLTRNGAVEVRPGAPPQLVVDPSLAETASPAALSFHCARALFLAECGIFAAGADIDALARVTSAAQSFSGHGPDETESGGAGDWPEAARRFLVDRLSPLTRVALEEADVPAAWGTDGPGRWRRVAEIAADRFGLLACGSLRVALFELDRVLGAHLDLRPDLATSQRLEPNAVPAPTSLWVWPEQRRLCEFVLSASYPLVR